MEARKRRKLEPVRYLDVLPKDVLDDLLSFLNMCALVILARTCRYFCCSFKNELTKKYLPQLDEFLKKLSLDKWNGFLASFPRTFLNYTGENYYYQSLIPIFYCHVTCGPKQRFCKVKYRRIADLKFDCLVQGTFIGDDSWTSPVLIAKIEIDLETDLKNYLDLLRKRRKLYNEDPKGEYEQKLIDYKQSGEELPCKPRLSWTNLNNSGTLCGSVQCVKDPICDNFFTYVNQKKKIFIIHVLTKYPNETEHSPSMYPFAPFMKHSCNVIP